MFRKNRHFSQRPLRRFRSSASASLRQGARQSGSGFSEILLFGLVLFALILLVLDKTNNRQLTQLRSHALDAAAPLLELAKVPAGYIQRSLDRVQSFYELNRKLTRLQEENRRLRSMKWNMDRLEQSNARLKALLNSAEDAPLKFVTGRVIAGNPSLFGRHMLVNVGQRNGIQSGYAVINAQGFIGRTVETGQRTSRILLLTDKASRVPVVIGKQAVRAMAIGTGTALPKIAFLPLNTPIYEGDYVFTSGHGGELPGGLPIGVVKKIGQEYRIALAATQPDTEYVSVLYFDHPDLAENRP